MDQAEQAQPIQALQVLEEQQVNAGVLRPEERVHTIEMNSMERGYCDQVLRRIRKKFYAE